MGIRPDVSASSEEVTTRGRLLVAALESFARQSFDGSSVRQIERDAGVQRGLVAYHFGTKDQLWEETVDALWLTFVKEIEALMSYLRDVSMAERRRAVFKAFVRYNASNPHFFRVLVAEGSQHNWRSEHLARHLRQGLDLWRTVLALEGEADVRDETSDAIIVYQVIGAAATAFAMSAYGEAVFGVNPTTPEFVERYADDIASRAWVRQAPDQTL